MLTELVVILVLGIPYYLGLINLPVMLILLGTIYWLPKSIFIKALNNFYPDIITHNDYKDTQLKNYKNKYVALTFDDVPNGLNGSYVQIQKLLDKYNMKGTFFIISDYVDELNDIFNGEPNIKSEDDFLTDLVEKGHQLGNHGKTNSMHALKSIHDLETEIITCKLTIERIYKNANKELPFVNVYRPGCGLWTSNMIKLANIYNYKTVLGSVYPNDPIFFISYLNYLYLRFHIARGDIIILHDRSWTPKTLEYLLKWMVKNNYESVTVDELFAK